MLSSEQKIVLVETMLHYQLLLACQVRPHSSQIGINTHTTYNISII